MSNSVLQSVQQSVRALGITTSKMLKNNILKVEARTHYGDQYAVYFTCDGPFLRFDSIVCKSLDGTIENLNEFHKQLLSYNYRVSPLSFSMGNVAPNEWRVLIGGSQKASGVNMREVKDILDAFNEVYVNHIPGVLWLAYRQLKLTPNGRTGPSDPESLDDLLGLDQ